MNNDLKIWISTYEWAILAGIIGIGVLAYYGVFSPNNLKTNLCLENYAIKYCNSQNLSYSHISGFLDSFYCSTDLRKGNHDIKFYFLKNETDDCNNAKT